jgi:glutamyl-tRNA synthetase
MTNRPVRVRFAPSPTGPLHIGGVRTALFNYLFALKHGGTFILRIEDTDQTRFVPGAEEYVNESLGWLGIKINEGVKEGGAFGPYKQSERREIYRKYAQQLIESDWAYYAFDTSEQLDSLRSQHEAEKKTFAYDLNTRLSLCNSLTLSTDEVNARIAKDESYVIRFKMPENYQVVANDLVRGEVSFSTSILDDKVLFKSADDLPTYHLANIVDDYLMQISHVIRGEEWLPSLPLHVMLYKAFGWEDKMPQFAHLPLILKPNGKGKLSKRDGDKDGFPVFPIEWKSAEGEISAGYRESGYYPEAVLNILALLGWNPGTEQELFNAKEMAELFTIERVNKAGARFDPEKAKWFNHQYLVQKSDSELFDQFDVVLKQKGVVIDSEVGARIISLVKERVNFVHEIWDQTSFFFIAPVQYDTKVVAKVWKPEVVEFLKLVSQSIKMQEVWKSDDIKLTVSNLIQQKEQSFGVIMNALRLVLVGGSFGPDLFTIVEILGKSQSIERIEKAIESIR